MSNNKLFSEFAPTTTQEWMDKITKDLKGADFERKLVWRTNEGFNVNPFYRQEDLSKVEYLDTKPGEFPYVRGNKTNNNAWFIRQDIVVEDFKAANAKALDILNKGIDSLGFVFTNNDDITKENIETLLKDIATECVEINFTGSCGSSKIIDVLNQMGVKINGSVGFDPIGSFTLKGNFCCSEEKSFEIAKELVEKTADNNSIKVLNVNANIFNNSGAAIVEDLGFALAAGVEYIDRLTENGLSIDQIAPKIKFNFATGSNYFMEMAKIRAARLLWAKIVEAYNPSNKEVAKMNIHAETSEWNKTMYDPYVNMLRTQTEAMSTVIAGVDSFTVNPFNKIYEESTDFSERIARNQQLLLKEESYFDKIVDPAAGSYYIETLTDSIAEQAWAIFVETQEKGGYLAAFKAGFVQERIKTTANKRDLAVATRKENFLGTNQFPNFNEPLEMPSEEVLKAKDLTRENAICETLKPYRGAQAFENLRIKTDIFSKENKRPSAYMFTIGNLNMRKARAQFACNFFACAGFEVVDHNGFTTIEEGVANMKENNADIVVVCSSDDEYAELVPQIHEQLKDKIIVVAGAPACADELKAKGIENFVNVKSNVLETLREYQGKLGIK